MPRRLCENSLPSFAAALEAGADGIELDVHASADGVVVVHHDPELRGMEIARSTWHELRAIELAPGIAMPTLLEVCALVAGRVELFVEIKGAEIESRVVDALRDYTGPAAIHSFDHALIRRLALQRAPYRLGLLYDEQPREVVAAMREMGAMDVWPNRRFVTQRLIDDVHSAGGRVIPWTVNAPRDARRFASWGVDGLCTDDVSLLPVS